MQGIQFRSLFKVNNKDIRTIFEGIIHILNVDFKKVVATEYFCLLH